MQPCRKNVIRQPGILKLTDGPQVNQKNKSLIIILVDFLGFLRRAEYRCSSLDLDTIGAILNREDLSYKILSFQDIIESPRLPENHTIWYAGSDLASYRNYIEDILLVLKDKNTLVPGFELFRAHENKGFQELLRQKLGLPRLNSHYFGTVEELEKLVDRIEFPVVLKDVMGSGSKNVYLANNWAQLRGTVKSLSRTRSFYLQFLKKYLKRYFFRRRYRFENTLESLHYKNFIVQQFVPGLTSDWRVLIFQDNYYVLARRVKKRDFRASGSGKKYYEAVDPSLLDFSERIFKRLNTPWASLDICRADNGYHLLEFQMINFASGSMRNSRFFYTRNKADEWVKQPEKRDLSTAVAEAFVQYYRLHSNPEQ